jgi:sugar phosphate isomerase/epimerase
MDTQNYFLRKGYHTAGYIQSISHLLCNEIHVKDGIDGQISSALLGKGETSFKETVQALKLIEYSGWLILENYYDRKPLSQLNKNPLLLIKQDINHLKGLFCQIES